MAKGGLENGIGEIRQLLGRNAHVQISARSCLRSGSRLTAVLGAQSDVRQVSRPRRAASTEKRVQVGRDGPQQGCERSPGADRGSGSAAGRHQSGCRRRISPKALLKPTVEPAGRAPQRRRPSPAPGPFAGRRRPAARRYSARGQIGIGCEPEIIQRLFHDASSASRASPAVRRPCQRRKSMRRRTASASGSWARGDAGCSGQRTRR